MTIEDINADGYWDLVCQFEDASEMWVAGEDEAVLARKLADGEEFEGSDSICIVP